MELIKWEPLGDFNRFFNNDTFPSLPKLGWDLSVDVYEEDGKIIAKMSLPGVDADETEISVDDDILTISGRRAEEKEVTEKNYYSKEIRRGSFSRSVHLPRAVDANKAEAQYEDGVLTVIMPVTAGAKEKAVKVKINK